MSGRSYASTSGRGYASSMVEEALSSVVHGQLTGMRLLQDEESSRRDPVTLVIFDLIIEVGTDLATVSPPWGRRPNHIWRPVRYVIWLAITVGKLALLRAIFAFFAVL